LIHRRQSILTERERHELMQALGLIDLIYGSGGSLEKYCFRPLGQRTSTLSMVAADPNPQCRRLSLLEL
jgi:hypothetical protein